MRIARFTDTSQRVRYGAVRGDEIFEIDQAAGGLVEWISSREDLRKICEKAFARARPLPLDAVQLLAPIPCPNKFLALGGNYASHVDEIERLGIKLPSGQVWFNKQNSCIAGPFEDVVIPAQSTSVDYEGELAVVIGSRCRRVPAERAHEVVAGYMVCNDVSARDVQMKSPTITLGKSFDTHGPIGPWFVDAAEVSDPHGLRIRTWVNGELRQDGNTAEMRYSIFEQIAELTSVFTLEPGDILATGTPAGVAAAMRPPRFLVPGDRVRIEVESVGAIENRFVADAARMQIE